MRPLASCCIYFVIAPFFCSGVHDERWGNSSRRRRRHSFSVCRVLWVQVRVCACVCVCSGVLAPKRVCLIHVSMCNSSASSNYKFCSCKVENQTIFDFLTGDSFSFCKNHPKPSAECLHEARNEPATCQSWQTGSLKWRALASSDLRVCAQVHKWIKGKITGCRLHARRDLMLRPSVMINHKTINEDHTMKYKAGGVARQWWEEEISSLNFGLIGWYLKRFLLLFYYFQS